MKSQQPRRSLYLNDHESVAAVRVDASNPDSSIRRESIAKAVRLICPFDDDDDDDNEEGGSRSNAAAGHARGLHIRELGGGLSNRLYVVSQSSPGGDGDKDSGDGDGGGAASSRRRSRRSVLVRVHGEDDSAAPPPPQSHAGEGGFVDRNVENRILARLSSLGLAPTFHGRFENGRVEEFYEGYRPLRCEEMGDRRFAGGVAEAMARLHGTTMPEEVLSGGGGSGEIWERVEGWFDMAAAKPGEGEGEGGDSRDDEEDEEDLEEMRREWSWLESELRGGNLHPDTTGSDEEEDHGVGSSVGSHMAVMFFRQVVFTHMDCQSLNILTPAAPEEGDTTNENNEKEKEEAPIKLIDFEYASYNARATDVGNTFCEHCDMNNLVPKYEDQYPKPDAQDFFLRRYVSAADPSLARRLDGEAVEGGEKEDMWKDFLSAARREVGRHALISHLGWAVWAMAQKRRGCGIEFDYGKYAQIRMEGYRLFKGWFWPKTSKGSGFSAK